jgi:GGDEF domain-containing protein
LGKLNYFQQKTLTGDRALARVSEVIRSLIRSQDLPFKLMGSEFLIYVDQLQPEALTQLKNRLEQALQQDPVLKEIFNEQIRYLTSELEKTTDSADQQRLNQALSEVHALKDSPRATLKEKTPVRDESLKVDDFLNSLN